MRYRRHRFGRVDDVEFGQAIDALCEGEVLAAWADDPAFDCLRLRTCDPLPTRPPLGIFARSRLGDLAGLP